MSGTSRTSPQARAVSLPALKGHGTENDFLILPDLDGRLRLSSELIQAVCDRRSGIGADGILRVVPSEFADEPEVRAQANVAPMFMDYRNADGSIAEMCGNGIRVFAQYLRQLGLASEPLLIATRAGAKRVEFVSGEVGDQAVDSLVRVDMGRPRFGTEDHQVLLAGAAAGFVGRAVHLPNPHIVVEVGSAAELDALDLTRPPQVRPSLPEGQNVEFVLRGAPASIRLRVHERGAGETRSCGTGICAAVAAMRAAELAVAPPASSWTVDVPGGRCWVDTTEDGSLILTGPAVIVAEVQFALPWLNQFGDR